MAYINVDVDLDEFETYELCNELSRRFKAFGRKQITDIQKATLKQELAEVYALLNLTTGEIPSKTLNDQMKIDLFKSVWDKYTVWELENLLTNK